MKQFYPFKTICAGLCLLIFYSVRAQSPTTVTNSTTCTVVQSFNTTNGNFTSPSIYSDQYDYEFNWTGAGSSGMMVSSSAATFAPYEASLISPIYPNTAPDGTANIGFSYSVPAGTLYRIRVIRPNLAIGGVDILAMTSEGPPTAGGNANWRELPSGSGTICLQLLDADLHPGQNLRYEFTFYVTSTASSVSFDNFSLNSSAAAPLPVNFIGLVANRVDNGIAIRWDVGDEINVQRYEVERSENGVNFSTIGTVDANKKQVYNFTDYNNKLQQVFYRIKSVDLDGTAKYSGIVRFKNSNSYSDKLLLYPVPVHNQLTIQHSLLTRGKLTVSTVDGRILKVVTPGPGVSNTMIDVSSLSSGMYMLKLEKDDGKIETGSFVKE